MLKIPCYLCVVCTYYLIAAVNYIYTVHLCEMRSFFVQGIVQLAIALSEETEDHVLVSE